MGCVRWRRRRVGCAPRRPRCEWLYLGSRAWTGREFCESGVVPVSIKGHLKPFRPRPLRIYLRDLPKARSRSRYTSTFWHVAVHEVGLGDAATILSCDRALRGLSASATRPCHTAVARVRRFIRRASGLGIHTSIAAAAQCFHFGGMQPAARAQHVLRGGQGGLLRDPRSDAEREQIGHQKGVLQEGEAVPSGACRRRL